MPVVLSFIELLLSNEFHCANDLTVLLHCENIDTCVGKVYVHYVSCIELSSLASLSLSSHVNNLNVVVTSLSKLYDNVLAYCVSLQLTVAELIDASAAADCDGREYALVLTRRKAFAT